jgi:hypothetical protein
MFDKIIRAGWLLLAIAVFIAYCRYPKLRVISFRVDVDGIDLGFPSSFDVNVNR